MTRWRAQPLRPRLGTAHASGRRHRGVARNRSRRGSAGYLPPAIRRQKTAGRSVEAATSRTPDASGRPPAAAHSPQHGTLGLLSGAREAAQIAGLAAISEGDTKAQHLLVCRSSSRPVINPVQGRVKLVTGARRGKNVQFDLEAGWICGAPPDVHRGLLVVRQHNVERYRTGKHAVRRSHPWWRRRSRLRLAGRRRRRKEVVVHAPETYRVRDTQVDRQLRRVLLSAESAASSQKAIPRERRCRGQHDPETVRRCIPSETGTQSGESRRHWPTAENARVSCSAAVNLKAYRSQSRCCWLPHVGCWLGVRALHRGGTAGGGAGPGGGR
jgi:hypothetical protein